MQRQRFPILIGIGSAFALLAVIAIAIGVRRFTGRYPVAASITIPAPATVPATQIASPQSAPSAPAAYIDVLRTLHPDLPTTRPLKFPLDLSAAAHWIMTVPVYLSGPPNEDLWMTWPDGPAINLVLKEAVDPSAEIEAHVSRKQVVFVHWMPVDNGLWPPYLVCRRPDGRCELVWASGRRVLSAARDYQWDHAFSWNERFVVPTRSGVSVFTVEPQLSESYQELLPRSISQPGTSPAANTRPATNDNALADASFRVPQALIEAGNQSLLAWVPAERGKPAGLGVARFAGGSWSRLDPGKGWPANIVHLIPLLDGSVLQIGLSESGSATLGLNVVEKAAVDENQISQLVDGLSDVDQSRRNAAYDQLTRYGPGIWPILEKLVNDQPPEAQARLRQLLHDREQPTLGGMSLLGKKEMQVAARLSDGGAVFYAEQGVAIHNPDGDPSVRAPAWISVRPGHAIELLPPSLTADLRCGQSRLFAVGNDWVASYDADGPKQFIGNGFIKLLRNDESRFTELAGVDHRGRWVFHSTSGSETLIIDPTVPDPTPRLPVWELPAAASVGWDKDNWPVVEHGGAYALAEHDWRLLDEKEKIFTKPGEGPAAALRPSPAAYQPSTRASTTTASDLVPTAQNSQPPLYIDSDGSKYFGGLTDLRVMSKGGRIAIWALPPIANGSGVVHMVRTADGRIFLFNQPGRVLRILPTPAAVEPFKIEATFTQDIPSIDNPTRVWLDPAGRIDIAWDNHIAVLFPKGYIPAEIKEKMLKRQ